MCVCNCYLYKPAGICYTILSTSRSVFPLKAIAAAVFSSFLYYPPGPIWAVGSLDCWRLYIGEIQTSTEASGRSVGQSQHRGTIAAGSPSSAAQVPVFNTGNQQSHVL